MCCSIRLFVLEFSMKHECRSSLLLINKNVYGEIGWFDSLGVASSHWSRWFADDTTLAITVNISTDTSTNWSIMREGKREKSDKEKLCSKRCRKCFFFLCLAGVFLIISHLFDTQSMRWLLEPANEIVGHLNWRISGATTAVGSAVKLA